MERESLSELQNQRIGLETKLTRAQTFLNNSGRLDFRIKDRLILDPQDPNYAEKTIKLGVSRRRLRESVIPSFQTELSAVDGKINSFVINETLVSRRYQLQQMQELVLSGDLTQSHLQPIIDEIAELEVRRGITYVDEEVIRLGPPQAEAEILAKASAQVAEIRERVKEGNLNPALLGEVYLAYEFLGGTIDEVFPTIPVAPREPETTPEVEGQPRIPLILDPKERTVKIGQNNPVRLGELEFVLIQYIYDPKQSNKEIPSIELQQIINEAGSRNQKVVGSTAAGIESKFGRKLFGRSVGRNARWAALEEFEVSFVTSEPAEPAEHAEAADQEGDIPTVVADIQRLAERGVLTDSVSLGRAQDIARKFGENFWIYETTEPIPAPVVSNQSRFRKLTAEDLATLDSRADKSRGSAEYGETMGQQVDSTVAVQTIEPRARTEKDLGVWYPKMLSQGPTNTREFGRFLGRINFSIVSGGSDLKIYDSNGKYVWSISTARAGGRSLATGTYRTALRKIERRWREITDRNIQ